MKKLKNCNCGDWQTNIDEINSGLILLQSHGMKVCLKFFIYCPWCGKKLIET